MDQGGAYIQMITPLIRKCEKLGNGLAPEVLEELRMKIITPQIEENSLSEGDLSYFPKGYKTKARIFRISHGQNGCLYLEINHVELKTPYPSLWQLTDEDRTQLHASGVCYCYYGEDVCIALHRRSEATT